MLRLPISDPKNTRISRILSGTVPLSLVVRQQKSELLRVFRPLPQMPQGETVALRHSATPEHTADATLIKVLQEQLQQANEREQQAREREVHLLALLETAQQVLQAEQQARRELETKLLPAPSGLLQKF